MWTPTTREQHSRPAVRYQTDLTDAEWRLIEPHLPAARKTGRPRSWSMREIVNAIFYVLRGGIAWRLMPSDFPPWPTVYRWFAAFRDGSVFEKINHALVMADRERVGRDASPSAAIIDSQSVKTTESGGPRGYDAGKNISGRSLVAAIFISVMVEMYVGLLAGMIMLGLGGSSFTKDFAVRYLVYAFSVGMKLMALVMIARIGSQVLVNLASGPSGTDEYLSTLAIAGISVVVFIISIYVPNIIQGVVQPVAMSTNIASPCQRRSK